MEKLYKLKWLNGPLVGRELLLPLGELQLGGPDADIALLLEQDTQATLVTTADSVTLTGSAPVWVDGCPWDTAQPLPFGLFIDVAGQALVLGPRAANLPTLAPLPRRAAGHAKLMRWQKWSGPAGVASLALGAVLLLAWTAPQMPPFDLWLSTQLRQPALAGLSVAHDAHGTLVLEGLCTSSEAVQVLRTQLRDQGLQVRDQTMCADTLRRNVRDVLALNGYRDSDVESGATSDTVMIRGALTADAAWPHLAMQLQAIPALRSWQVINDRSASFERLLTLLAARTSLDGLSIFLVGKTLLVSGQVAPFRAQVIGKAIAIFNQENQQLRAMFQSLPSNPSASTLLPAAIVGVGGQADSIYVELANGMRLQSGSVLPSGFQIRMISHTSMALIKGVQLVSLPLNLSSTKEN
ncbi:Probable type-III secretion protein [Mycoavidus cysteinexigens]|uniref:Probable type-III secretion protein n=2 Tax=Mycoavidus cysteinexigens TaxID=1553431 RepID=A0A2Z6ETQ7_9BURK|nr:type III secretion system inner membrane ring subunit SctD [Mycoavidus cysteinexigens]BBE08772.1 Probable type-III secretion protein [Mycoavidus cysteinexigens]GAM52514.1 type III secretion protein SsaD [bacterium endosymbiont of Mortierella elongata FMR23-6]GLR01594.1 hypothetical protein GCM10007934_14060 [Mycoavidus cysteinexigens]